MSVNAYASVGRGSSDRVIDVLRTPRKVRKSLPVDFIKAAKTSPDSFEKRHSTEDTPIDPIWVECIEAPGSHSNGKEELATIGGPTPIDQLTAFIERFSATPLLPAETPTLSLYIASVLAPLISHSNELTSSLVSLYLDDLNLLDHLDVLRAFFLAGDVGFTERANAALFGKDQAGAGEALGLGRRARTRARMGLTPGPKGKRVPSQVDHGADDGDWGIGLGLGLSERQQWPPGGVELAYALRTTLFDVSREGQDGAVWEGIEDRVSFAVRDLPEGQDGEGANWMNPQCEFSRSEGSCSVC